MIRKLTVTLSLLLASAGVAHASGWFDTDASGNVKALAKAHQAYLGRDYKAMTKAVHEVLADGGAGAVERKNVLSLLNRAFTENGGKLPADWSLPANLNSLKFKHYRKDLPDGIEYSYELAVNGLEADSVSNLKLVKFPSEILLDREAGIGEWSTEADGDAYYFGIYGGDRSRPLPDGLYLFTITLKDGSKVEGWFPLEDLTSSASPVVSSPGVGQTFDSANPEMSWEDFRSPEYKSYERRLLGLGVGRLDGPNGAWQDVWSHHEADPTRTTAVVGVLADSQGPSSLEDGKYWLSITYGEQRQFGDLKMRRGSRTARPFFVRAAR